MSLNGWFETVRHTGRNRYEMLDRLDPTAWVIDPAGHRAQYTGRVIEERTDEHGHLTRGVLRRMTLSFNLPPSVSSGPGTGVPPPSSPPSSEEEEDPVEDLSTFGAPHGQTPQAVVDPVDIPSTSRLVEPKREPVVASPSQLGASSSSRGYRVEPLVRVEERLVRSEVFDVETGVARAQFRVARREVVDLDTDVITVEDSDTEGDYTSEEEEEGRQTRFFE